MKIKMIKQEVVRGEPADYVKCAVALAITRHTGWRCWVFLERIWLETPGRGMLKLKSPPKVKDFIRKFDSRARPELMKPITFTLPL